MYPLGRIVTKIQHTIYMYYINTTSLMRNATLDLTLFTYFGHLLQFFHVPSDEVEEGETVKVFGPLVCHFYYLQYIVTYMHYKYIQLLH